MGTAGSKCLAINVATGNNLFAASACCFGFHAIKSPRIMDACPFYMLVAPENEITFGFVEDDSFEFYRDAFTARDLSNCTRSISQNQ